MVGNRGTLCGDEKGAWEGGRRKDGRRVKFIKT